MSLPKSFGRLVQAFEQPPSIPRRAQQVSSLLESVVISSRNEDRIAPSRSDLDRRPIGAPPTGSDLETQYLQVLRRGGVPAPERQWPVIDPHGQQVAIADAGFPPWLFVAETDDLGTHKTREQQQYDLNRQNRISDAGYHLRRFTYGDVTTRPAYVCRETMRGLLGAPIAREPLRV